SVIAHCCLAQLLRSGAVVPPGRDSACPLPGSLPPNMTKDMNSTLSPRLLTPEQVAQLLGVSPRAVRTEKEAGRLAFIKVAGKIMFRREAVDEFITANEVKECQGAVEGHASPSLPSVAATTSAGPRAVAPGSVASLRAILDRLKRPSPGSSPSGNVQPASVL